MKKLSLIMLLMISSLGLISTAHAQGQQFPSKTKDIVWIEKDNKGESIVHLYLYWSLVCPHCEKALPYFKKLAKTNPWLKLHLLEVSKHKSNLSKMNNMAAVMDEFNNGEVPAFFFCGIMYTGYGDNKTTGAWIRDTLKECHAQ